MVVVVVWGWCSRVFDRLCSSSSSSVREMYSSRHSLATSGIENEKLAENVCMNAAGQLARGEREGAAVVVVVVRGISWYL